MEKSIKIMTIIGIVVQGLATVSSLLLMVLAASGVMNRRYVKTTVPLVRLTQLMQKQQQQFSLYYSYPYSYLESFQLF